MEQTIVVNIDTWRLLTILSAIVAWTWYTAYRLGKVETKVETLDAGVAALRGRVDDLYAGRSPARLLFRGAKILEESGLRRWIDENRAALLGQCRKRSAMENPYDIQAAVFAFFDKITFPPSMEENLKTCAFRNGIEMNNLRRIGGIYFRDLCLDNAGFELQDLSLQS